MKKNLLKTISYILQLTDSARFMTNSLSNLVNNPSEGIDKIKCKHGHDDKKVKIADVHTKYATVFLNTQILQMI